MSLKSPYNTFKKPLSVEDVLGFDANYRPWVGGTVLYESDGFALVAMAADNASKKVQLLIACETKSKTYTYIPERFIMLRLPVIATKDVPEFSKRLQKLLLGFTLFRNAGWQVVRVGNEYGTP